ncbi:MAG: hypothetical protein GJ680_03945 [Alteromonadaceae bacterium]|nr:hypothetical protein [Alteromonadaceae bacterium]
MSITTFTNALMQNSFFRFLYNLQDLFWIVLIVALFLGYGEFQRKQRMQLVHSPLVNDFFFVDYYQIDKSSDRKYRYLPVKITHIDSEHVAFVAGNYGHSKPASIDNQVKFDAPMQYRFFKKQEFFVSRAEFEAWAKQGIIYDVARPEKFYINGWIVLTPGELLRGNELNRRYLTQAA